MDTEDTDVVEVDNDSVQVFVRIRPCSQTEIEATIIGPGDFP